MQINSVSVTFSQVYGLKRTKPLRPLLRVSQHLLNTTFLNSARIRYARS